MALSFRREPSTVASEALVFAEGFSDFDQLADDLDAEFGQGQWEEIGTAEAEMAIQSSEGSSFAIFALSSDEPAEVEDTAQLIRLALDAGLMVMLVVGDVSSRSTHRNRSRSSATVGSPATTRIFSRRS